MLLIREIWVKSDKVTVREVYFDKTQNYVSLFYHTNRLRGSDLTLLSLRNFGWSFLTLVDRVPRVALRDLFDRDLGPKDNGKRSRNRGGIRRIRKGWGWDEGVVSWVHLVFSVVKKYSRETTRKNVWLHKRTENLIKVVSGTKPPPVLVESKETLFVKKIDLGTRKSTRVPFPPSSVTLSLPPFSPFCLLSYRVTWSGTGRSEPLVLWRRYGRFGRVSVRGSGAVNSRYRL